MLALRVCGRAPTSRFGRRCCSPISAEHPVSGVPRHATNGPAAAAAHRYGMHPSLSRADGRVRPLRLPSGLEAGRGGGTLRRDGAWPQHDMLAKKRSLAMPEKCNYHGQQPQQTLASKVRRRDAPDASPSRLFKFNHRSPPPKARPRARSARKIRLKFKLNSRTASQR